MSTTGQRRSEVHVPNIFPIKSGIQLHNKLYFVPSRSYQWKYLSNWIHLHRNHYYTRRYNSLECSYNSRVGYKWQYRSSHIRQHLSTTQVQYSRGIVNYNTLRYQDIVLCDGVGAIHPEFRFKWTLARAQHYNDQKTRIRSTCCDISPITID